LIFYLVNPAISGKN